MKTHPVRIDGKRVDPTFNRAISPDTIYCERANGRWEYWTYSDGRRIYVSADWANTQVRRSTARMIELA